jgi:hypothetical protein
LTETLLACILQVEEGVGMPKARSIVELNDPSEGFTIFVDELTPGMQEVRGQYVDIDVGDYAHAILGDEDKEARIHWIKETLVNPEEIRSSHLRSKPYRENYLNIIYESEDDPVGMPFVVGVNRRRGRLDFRTAIIPTHTYLKNLKKGKLLWRP